MTAMFDRTVRAGCDTQYVGEECLFPACETTTREDSACPHTKRTVLATIASLAELDDAMVEAMVRDLKATLIGLQPIFGQVHRLDAYCEEIARAAWAAGMASIHKSN
jgi:hypothetical protein